MIKPKKNIEALNRMQDYGNDRSSFVRLDKNERTIPFPKDIFEDMLNTITNNVIPMYPDQTLLYNKLSKFLSVENNNILLTSGSDAAIKSIYETYISADDQVIYLWPTYAMIDVYANMFEAKKIKIGYSPNLELEFESLMAKIDENTRVVFIANPNQPTGTIMSDNQIDELIQKTEKTETLLVFDEAYQPFSGKESTIKYVKKYSHVVVIQTFSKAFGLASVRLGFIITQPINIQSLYKVKPYADINLLAIKFGEYLLDNYWIVKEYINAVNESKSFLEIELNNFNAQIINSHANFLHIKFDYKYDLELLAKRMKKKGYLIRTTGSGLPAVLKDCIRITVGPVEQMKNLVIEMKSILRDMD